VGSSTLSFSATARPAARFSRLAAKFATWLPAARLEFAGAPAALLTFAPLSSLLTELLLLRSLATLPAAGFPSSEAAFVWSSLRRPIRWPRTLGPRTRGRLVTFIPQDTPRSRSGGARRRQIQGIAFVIRQRRQKIFQPQQFIRWRQRRWR
jgi:hypothetical protein